MLPHRLCAVGNSAFTVKCVTQRLVPFILQVRVSAINYINRQRNKLKAYFLS